MWSTNMNKQFKMNGRFWIIMLSIIAPGFVLGQTNFPRSLVENTTSVAPVLLGVDADPDDLYWDDRFDVLGVDGTVLTLAFDGSDLYVGGSFSTVGGVAANNIAKWDGTTWSSVGIAANNGVDGTVLAIKVTGTDIIVGGSFSMAGEVSVNNIARWDGNVWSALGGGISDGDVRAIVNVGSDFYVAGVFNTVGGVTANNIAKWDGNNWSSLGTGASNGLSGPSYAMAAKDDLLYIGGSFTSAGGIGANNIVAWNTSNETWAPLGSGVTLGDVNSVQASGSNIFVAGTFTTAGGQSAKKIAEWNGNTWSALGDGITSGNVNTLAMIGGNLYVAGSFTTSGNVSTPNISKWDGNGWNALGSGISGGIVFTIAASGENLYAGGSFTSAGGKTSTGFAHWTDLDGSVPVELVSFSSELSGEIVNLQWVTATETNNFGFDVERAIVNGSVEKWEKIAFVKGRGTTAEPQYYSFTDDVKSLTANSANYRLKQIDLDGQYAYSNVVTIKLAGIPSGLSLSQNYPNPFNPKTTIEFSLADPGHATIKVYNMRGQIVATLADENIEAGVQHKVQFSGANLPSGMYFYVLSVGNLGQVEKRTMTLVK
jgi:hypothetical protein